MKKISILIFLLISTSSFADSANTIEKNKKPHHIHKVIDRQFANNVFSEICSQKILYPEIVMKQAILETFWFKSHYLISRNNLFAFRKFKYLKFASWQRSIEYYKEWQEKNLKGSDVDYYKFLVRIKYADDGYIQNLKRVKWTKSCEITPLTSSTEKE